MELEEIKTLENRNNFLLNESAILYKDYEFNKLTIKSYLKETELNKIEISRLRTLLSDDKTNE